MKKNRQLPVFCCLLSAVCCLLTGCVYRSLTIKTNPPGAKVYVNDELKGESPVTYDFTWYGWHRVTLRKDGYQRLDDRRLLRAPVYLWIPLDLVMELLPFPIRDQRVWAYDLISAPELPTPVPPQLLKSKTTPAAPPILPKPQASEPVTTVESEQPQQPDASAAAQPAKPALPATESRAPEGQAAPSPTIDTPQPVYRK